MKSNRSQQTIEIFYRTLGQFAGKTQIIKAGKNSDKINGILLTIDVIYTDRRLSYDFTYYLPNDLWVKNEPPLWITASH